jgi:hypothetical protein
VNVVDLDTIPRHGEAVIYRVVLDTAILLNLDNDYYYSLDPLGSRIWSMCDGTRALGSILDQVCAEYDVARERARCDLLELFDDLQREGLVTIDGVAA